jgi:competence protein ComEC
VRERGVLVALGGLVLGIVGGERAGPAPATFLLAVGLVALAGAWFVGGRARLAIAVVALALIGGAQTQRALDGEVRSALTPAIERRAPGTFSGVLVDDPQSGRFDTDAYVRVAVGGTHRTLYAVATGDDALRFRVLEAGDRVVIQGRLGRLHPDRFDGRARWKHAVGRLDRAQVIALAPARGALRFANGLRDVVLRGTAPLAPTSRALLAGFLLGDTRSVPDDVVLAYRNSGLSHLLAVSGENVAFTLALFGPLLRRLDLGPRTVAATLIVLLFATMTRFEPSVLRASALSIIALGSSFVGRPASSIRALALAIIALLGADPFLLHSVAFWLSCGASAGIAILSVPIRARLPGPEWLRGPLAVSFAAQAGVTPVLLATFGTVPVVTPLANLLAAPAAEAVGVYGMLAGAVGGLVPRFAPVLQVPSAVLISWVTTVARLGAAVGLEIDRRSAWLLLAVGCAATAALTLRRRRGGVGIPVNADGAGGAGR